MFQEVNQASENFSYEKKDYSKTMDLIYEYLSTKVK